MKDFLAACLIRSGVIALLRRALWRDRVLILVYHDPSPQVLDQHLSYLRRIADPVELRAVNSPSTGRPRFAVTLDDGHAGNRQLLDVFKAHGVKATIFLCSQIVGTRRQFWWQSSAEAKRQAECFKRQTNSDRLESLARLGYSQEAEQSTRSALSNAEIREMNSICDFGSHGRFHPILTSCEDNECRDEIIRSRPEIQQMTGKDCICFAYPNGNYGEREKIFVRSAGYTFARTCDLGWNDERTDPFRLKAVAVSDDSSLTRFVMQISMIAPYLRYLRAGSWTGRFRQF